MVTSSPLAHRTNLQSFGDWIEYVPFVCAFLRITFEQGCDLLLSGKEISLLFQLVLK